MDNHNEDPRYQPDYYEDDSELEEQMKDMGHRAKEAGQDAWDATKRTASKAGDKIEEGVTDVRRSFQEATDDDDV